MDKKVIKILHGAFKEELNALIFQKALENLSVAICYRNNLEYDQFIHASYPKFTEAVKMVGLEKKK